MSRKGLYEKQSADAGVDIRRYLMLFVDNINLFCAIVLIFSLCGIVVSYILPKKYEANSLVSVEQSVVSDLVKGIVISPSVDAKMRLLKVYLLSRDMLLQVASALDMDLEARTPSQKDLLADTLKKEVSITHDERRGLFSIAYVDKNPVLARDFVNTMTRFYIEGRTASKRQESYDATAFLGEQIQLFQKRISEVQAEIDTFKSQKGMYLGLNEQLLRQKIRETEQRLEHIRIRKTELQTKMALLTDQSTLRDKLRAREVSLQTLLSAYTERHPAVIRIQEDIKSLRETIEQESKNEDSSKYGSEYQGLSIELRSLAEIEENLKALLAEDNRDLQELPSIRTQLSDLEQRRDNERTIYQQLVARFGQSEVSKQMELQDKAVSFNVIEAAVVPTNHKFPLRYMIILGSIVLGFCFAGGCLLINDLLRGKIHSANDLREFDLKVLAKLPQLVPIKAPEKSRRKIIIISGTFFVVLIACVIAWMEFMQFPYVERAIALAKRVIFS